MVFETMRVVRGIEILIVIDADKCAALASKGEKVDEFREHYQTMKDALGIAERIGYFPGDILEMLKSRALSIDELARNKYPIGQAA